MALTRIPASACLPEVLDRVLDKGLVIDAWLRVSVPGLDLATLQARVVVASIQVFTDHVQPRNGRAQGNIVLPVMREVVRHWPGDGTPSLSPPPWLDWHGPPVDTDRDLEPTSHLRKEN